MYRLSTSAMFPALLEITYLEGSTTKYLRLVNNTEDMVYGGNTYTEAIFKYTPPSYSDKKMGDGTISISSVDQSIVTIIRSIQTRASACVVAAFYYDDGTLYFEGIEEWVFELSLVNWNGTVATWTMEYDTRMSIRVPCDKMTAQKCPGVA